MSDQRDRHFDVIVVGAGGSGLAAAQSAAEHGGRVLVLEKRPQPGGTTGIAVGSFTAAGTSLQRDARIEDDAQAHAADAAKFAASEIESRNNEALRAYFLRHAADTFDWLRDLGLAFVGPHPEPPNRVPRMHNVVPGAKAYVAALQVALVRRGAQLLCNAHVERLLQDKDGRVVGAGVRLDNESIELYATRGVILAAGDYSNNDRIIAAHMGDDFRSVEGINPFATGEGHELAEEAGARLVNMDIAYGPELRFVASSRRPFQQWLPTGRRWSRVFAAVTARLPGWVMRTILKRLLVTWQHPEAALFDDGAILINREGRRFVNERQWPDREIETARQAGKIAYLLLDGRLAERYSAWPHFISTAPDIAYAYLKDYQRLRSDVTTTGGTIADVAAGRAIDIAAVKQTVEQFNRYAAGECPDPLGRCDDRHGLTTGPWVLLGPVKAYFTTTEGGAAVNQRLQVLDDEGKVIPGLYAVGQNGLGGMILWGHGLHIAWALTSGRLAGKFIMSEPC